MPNLASDAQATEWQLREQQENELFQLQQEEDNERHQLMALVAQNRGVAPAPAPEMAKEVLSAELSLTGQQMQNLNQLIQQQIQQQKQIAQQLHQEMEADNFFAAAMAPAPGQPTAAQQQTTQIDNLVQEEASDIQVHQQTMTNNLQDEQHQYQSDFQENWGGR